MQGARKLTPLQIRLPVELRRWLKTAAETNLRSMNSEIVANLEASRKTVLANQAKKREEPA